ncbi:MAG: RNA methyltransferase [Acidobacteriota bacterium]
MTIITSRQHPFVRRCRDIVRGRGDGDILLDGEHLVDEALSAGVTVHLAAISRRALSRPSALQLRTRLEDAGTPCLDVSDGVLDAASPVQTPSGTLAIAARPTWPLAKALAGPNALVVAIAGVQDPGNVGAIVRAADAAAATGVVAVGPTADPFGWKALRGAMGSAFRLPVAVETDWSVVRDQARSLGLRLVGLVPRDGVSLYDADLEHPALVVAGAEGSGLAAGVASDLEVCITISMRSAVESLNVAVAVGITLFEAGRQRRGRT